MKTLYFMSKEQATLSNSQGLTLDEFDNKVKLEKTKFLLDKRKVDLEKRRKRKV